MDLPPLTRFSALSAFPGLVHGVSTRLGGVSEGPFASLNLGWTVGDEKERVEANYQRFAAALAVPRRHLTTTWQVHSSLILRARAEDRGSSLGKADGLVTDEPNLPLSQRYADCTPLLVYDPRRHAAGIAHAGWRGTVINTAGALVAAMQREFGSRPADLVAVIGPAIGPCCYEVGPEVVASIRDAFPVAEELLVAPNGATLAAQDRLHFDLWAANRWQLAEAGVVQIEMSGVCTCCQRELYFSHRGDRGRTGRFAGVVMLKG